MSEVSKRCRISLAALLWVSWLSTDLVGQSTINVGSGVGAMGELTTIEVTMDTLDLVQGWSFGVCHNEAELEVIAAGLGSDALALNSTAGPDYAQVSLETGGVTTGAIVCFSNCQFLGPGIGNSILEITYTSLAPGGSVSGLEVCSTLGAPPVDTVVTVANDTTTPTTTGGTITVETHSFFELSNVIAGIGSQVSVPLQLTSQIGLTGVQIACEYDPLELFFIEAVPSGTGANVDFFALQENPVPGEIGVGMIQDLTPPLTTLIPASDHADLMEIRFFVSPLAEVGTVIPVLFAAEVGSPPLQNRVVLENLFDTPNLSHGSITVVDAVTFLRGDCNGDVLIDLSDPIFLLLYLFAGADTPECLDACDPNDDGNNDTGDAIYLVNYLFSDGPEPPAPFLNPGPDPTNSDALDCGGP